MAERIQSNDIKPVEEPKGKMERAARFGKRVSIFTLPLGLGAAAFGAATGNPVLAGLGLGGAAMDGAQIVVGHTVEKNQANKRMQEAAQQQGESKEDSGGRVIPMRSGRIGRAPEISVYELEKAS